MNLILISSVHIQVKKRFPGTLFILLSFLTTAIGNILVYFRDFIPDWVSITVANGLIVLSMIIALIGFEHFVNCKKKQTHNFVLLIIFLLVQYYFSIIEPNFTFRIINISTMFILISSQIAYLIFVRTPLPMRKITLPIGYVFTSIIFIQFFHIIYTIQIKDPAARFFNSQSLEPYFLLSWLIITILLAYSIVLMCNQRLIIDVNQQEEKFSKAFHAAPFVMMLSKFPSGEIFEVNKTIEHVSDYKPEDFIGLSSVELELWAQKRDREKFISDLATTGSVTENEYIFRKKSGKLFPGLITSQIIKINNEDCMISVVNDITVRKNAELKLKNSEASLRELNATKDKFFSIIAHDLRSPFNGILGFSEILKEQIKQNNYDGIEEYAEIINKSSEKAMDLLTSLMEWSKSQTGRIQFNPSFIDLAPLMNSTVDLLKTSSKQKLLKISMHIPDNIIIYADKAMIEAVLRNIISNAIKFTPQQGSIKISVEEQAQDFLVSVTDNGIGIEPDNLEKLFRIDQSHSTLGTDKESGTGLGLILCKDFIDYHQGKIWAESKQHVGTTILFSLPKTQKKT
jgi:PAS domain S-box-containing protein